MLCMVYEVRGNEYNEIAVQKLDGAEVNFINTYDDCIYAMELERWKEFKKEVA